MPHRIWGAVLSLARYAGESGITRGKSGMWNGPLLAVTSDDRQPTRPPFGVFLWLPHAPELRLLHRWLDLDRCRVDHRVERQDLLLMLSHIAEGKWRAQFMGNPLVAPKGLGVVDTPWRAVQRAAWAA
jgi:hypothetical protein